jgi:hypothetical protein
MSKCVTCTDTFDDASKFYCPYCCTDANPTVTVADWVRIVAYTYENMTQEKRAEFRALAPEQRTVFMNSLLERVRAAHPDHRVNFDVGIVKFKF